MSVDGTIALALDGLSDGGLEMSEYPYDEFHAVKWATYGVENVKALAFSPTGDELVAWYKNDDTVVVIDVESCTVTDSMAVHIGGNVIDPMISALEFSSAGFAFGLAGRAGGYDLDEFGFIFLYEFPSLRQVCS